MDPELRSQILAALGKAHANAIAKGEMPTRERDDAFVRAATQQALGTPMGLDQLVPSTPDVTTNTDGVVGGLQDVGHALAHPLDTAAGIGKFLYGLPQDLANVITGPPNWEVGPPQGDPNAGVGLPMYMRPAQVTGQQQDAYGQSLRNVLGTAMGMTGGAPGVVAGGTVMGGNDPARGATQAALMLGLAKAGGAAARGAINTADAAGVAYIRSPFALAKQRALSDAAAAASKIPGGVAGARANLADLSAAGLGDQATLLDLGSPFSQLGTEAAAKNPLLRASLAKLKEIRDATLPQSAAALIQRRALAAAPEVVPGAPPPIGAAPSLAAAVGGEPTFRPGAAAPSTTPAGQPAPIETAPPERATTWSQDVARLRSQLPFDPLAWVKEKMGAPHAPTKIAQIEQTRADLTDPVYEKLRQDNPALQDVGGVSFDQVKNEPVVGGKPSVNQKALQQAVNSGWTPKSGSDIVPGTGGGTAGFTSLANWYEDLFGKKPSFQTSGDFNDWFRLKQGLDKKVGELVRSGETIGRDYNWKDVKALRDAVDQQLQGSVEGYKGVQQTYSKYSQSASDVQAGVDAWKARDPQAFQTALRASQNPDLFRQGAQSQWLQELQNSPSRTAAGIGKRIVNPTAAEQAMLAQTFGSPVALPELQATIQGRLGMPSMAEAPVATEGIKGWQQTVAQRIAESERIANETSQNANLQANGETIAQRLEAAKGMDPVSTHEQGMRDWKASGPPKAPAGAMSPTALYTYRQGLLQGFVDEVQGNLKDGAKIAEKFGNPDAITRAKLETAFGGRASVDALLKQLQAKAILQGSIRLPAIGEVMADMPAASMSPAWTAKKGLWNSMLEGRQAATASALRPHLFSSGAQLRSLLDALDQRNAPRTPSNFSIPDYLAFLAAQQRKP